MTDLKNRGIKDILVAMADGLKGFPDAITSLLPDAQAYSCIVHLILNSLDFVSCNCRRTAAAPLQQVYKAADSDAGAAALEKFAESN